MTKDSSARRKNILVQTVSRATGARNWRRISGDFRRWIDGLPDERFEDFLLRLSGLAGEPQAQDAPGSEGEFVAVSAAPPSSSQSLWEERRAEATVFYALALWKTFEAADLERLND